MSITIELPHVGESVVEGTIGKWLKQPGDEVKRYEPLVEIITDKVTMEVPSPVEGSVVKLLAEEGETLPMGAAIAEVATAESPEEAEPEAAAIKVDVTTPEESHSPGTTGYLLRDVTPVGPTGGAAVELAEPTRSHAETGQARPTPVVQPPEPAAPATTKSGQTRLSPAVRRLAQEHSLDISRVQGSGLGGRVTRDDVLKYLENGPAPTTASSTTTTSELVGSTSVDGLETHISVSPVRRMIAEAMVRSVTEIPHAWSTVEVDVSGLVALRSSVRTEFEKNQGGSLTYLPFVIKAVVEALKDFPTMNATWGGDKIILKKRVNLGLAVAAPEGLIVPVLHNADQFSIAGLAASANDLAERARTKKLTLDDVQGGTFTLNNTGALGSYVSGPIINYPQAGILTTETIRKRAVVIDDAIAIRSMMNLCLSFDHRINDGAEASGFLTAVKNKLQAFGPGASIY
uniref:Dihydrolipoamide acetyltransferase component of pyruvate dehydrogenase complex n=1 Tax=uncultured Chloroflexi bacterium HF0200_06I16 TaxID=710735 RepID=E0XU06_9CHLR|nr:pyruvate/2-oxoglutarate dehydrogenase complex, dihydrolipoamide acyltransferase (e2) component, and related enzymes [uncultured Chloroflexi bacterium HF0200_06I16]